MSKSEFLNKHKRFSCNDYLLEYSCRFCSFKTNEKLSLVKHVCGSGSQTGDEQVMLKHCKKCKFFSFSIAYSYFHSLECNFWKHISGPCMLEAKHDLEVCKIQSRIYQFDECNVCSLNVKNESLANLKNQNKCIDETYDKVISREQTFKCNLCRHETYRNYDFKRHTTHQHINLKYHKVSKHCDDLSKLNLSTFSSFTTARKEDLNLHFTMKHYKIKTIFYCNRCLFNTESKDTLDRHEQLKHLKQKVFKCDQCTYATHNPDCLRSHKRCKHLNDLNKIYYCNLCEYKTTRAIELKIHLTAKHYKTEKEFKCRECSFATYRKFVLTRHMKLMHLEREKKYQCDQCPFATHMDQLLKSHKLNRHLQGLRKYFQCELCDYKTTRKYSLGVHLSGKSHNNEKSFKCNNCAYETYTKSGLQRHMKQKHYIWKRHVTPINPSDVFKFLNE